MTITTMICRPDQGMDRRNQRLTRIPRNLLIACLTGLFSMPAAQAQTFPTKPIKLVVPFTPGTGYDSIARVVSPVLSQRLGQPVVVENMPGASSTIGATFVSRAPADGYTLLMIGEGTMASKHLYRKLEVDPLNDFAPITLAGRGTLMLMASPKSGIRTMEELITRAQAEPGGLTFASPGIGTSQYLKMELLMEAAKINMLHVPYKGSAGALNDLVGGFITASLVPVHQGMSYVSAGKLMPLAVLSAERSQKAPDVPTLSEMGIKGVAGDMWYAFVAPRSTPDAVIETLNRELRDIIAQPTVTAGLENIGLDVRTSTPAELKEVMRKESSLAAELVRKHALVLD